MDVKFKMGTGNLPEQDPGSFIVRTDTQEVYIDTNDGKRIPISGIILIDNEGNKSTVQNVIGIPMSITENGKTENYTLLAIKEEK